MSPGSVCTSGMAKPSETRPIRLTALAPCSRSTATIPEDSCPRCWREYRPRCVNAAAFSSPYIPKIPHISVGRHGIQLVEGRVFGRACHDARYRVVIGAAQARERAVERARRQLDVERTRVKVHFADLRAGNSRLRGDLEHARRSDAGYHDAYLAITEKNRSIR